MKYRLLLAIILLANAGCTQLLFLENYGECTEIFGRAGTQPIFLDSERVGDLRARNHHIGRPLDTVPINIGPELRDVGVESIAITAATGRADFSGCTKLADGMRACMYRNQRLSAAGAALEIRVSKELETWRILRETEEYLDQIAECDPHFGP